jgi:hypothetical protein
VPLSHLQLRSFLCSTQAEYAQTLEELRRSEQEKSSTIATVSTQHISFCYQQLHSASRQLTVSLRLCVSGQLEQRIRELQSSTASFSCPSFSGPVPSPPCLPPSCDNADLVLPQSDYDDEEGERSSRSSSSSDYYHAGLLNASSCDVSSAESDSIPSPLSLGDDGSEQQQVALPSDGWCSISSSRRDEPLSLALPAHQPERSSKRRRADDDRGDERVQRRDRAEQATAATSPASFRSNWAPCVSASFYSSGIFSSPLLPVRGSLSDGWC